MKLFAIGIVLLAISGFASGCFTVVAAIAAGKTVAGGERAVVAIGIADVSILLIATALFLYFGRQIALGIRGIGAVIFFVCNAALLTICFVLSMVMLNR